MQKLWGIDLGGTKIEGVVLSNRNSIDTLCRLRISTEADRGYKHVLKRISDLINMMIEQTGEKPAAVGFGTPGVSDPKSGLMKNCNTTCLNDQPLLADLHSALKVPVEIANDANCFALAEATFGAGRGANPVFGVIMGTGVGGGLVVGDRTIRGYQGIGGEWGHNVLAPNGPDCYCGKKGCVETIISGPRLEAQYRGLGGESFPLADIYGRFQSGGDHLAKQVIEGLIDHFARAIAVVINIIDPEVIVLGGGVSNIEELYGPATLEKVRRHVFNNRLETRILRNMLGDSAGVFGAAMLYQSDQLSR